MQMSPLQLDSWLLVHLMHLLGIHDIQLCIRAGAGVSVAPPPLENYHYGRIVAECVKRL